MSQINVDSIANTNENGPVYFPYGMRGDATNLIYEPKVLQFSPTPLSTGISTNTNITITFDQQIQFSGVGTIYIREGSPTGTITTSFTCGISTRATIAGETLVIDPAQPLGVNTTNYVILPSTGIANTFGAYYKGTQAYFFQTLKPSDLFSASGGTHEFTIASAPSPTGYYKYHVFTSTGILTTSSPSFDADSLSALAVGAGGGGGGTWFTPTEKGLGGGGGAGGRVYNTGPQLSLNAGTYTITIGAGGIGTDGTATTISTPTATIITAYGGGAGAGGEPSGIKKYGSPGGSGGGGSGNSTPTTPGLTTYGTGIPGQGNNGGGIGPYNDIVNPTQTQYVRLAGGGGGAGGAGGDGTSTFSAPAPGTSSNFRGPGTGGNGGPGSPSPEFSSPLIAPYVPTIPAGSWTEIGATGDYAGGGGGGSVDGPQMGYPSPAYPSGPISRGLGGPGGGGDGVVYYNPSPSFNAENGYANTGGGGGGGGPVTGTAPTPNPSPTNYRSITTAGGSGVFMIRYAVPAP